MVERSQVEDGPFEWLTPKGLSPQTTHFEDHDVHPGASYYYRVRAVTPGGSLGAAPDPVQAQALAPAALAAPQGLAAEVGTSQVVLTWSAVPGADLAGYILERRANERSQRWSRLNSRLIPATRYLDLIGAGGGGIFEYRVTAVATDEGVSAPSAVLRVALRNSEPPAPPVVLEYPARKGACRSALQRRSLPRRPRRSRCCARTLPPMPGSSSVRRSAQARETSPMNGSIRARPTGIGWSPSTRTATAAPNRMATRCGSVPSR